MYEWTKIDGTTGMSTILAHAQDAAREANSLLTYRGNKNEIVWTYKP